jgi:hypothetical protein
MLMILVVSCGTATTNTPLPSATLETSSNWWTAWLAQQICKPPCWQNITPGVTTIQEAESILENSPQIKIKFQSKDGIDWTFIKNKDESGTLKATEDGIVRVIWLGSASDRKLLLKPIVSSYGSPEYVHPDDCREGKCVTDLVYPKMGMFLSVFITNKGSIDNPQFEILSDTVVDRVYFVEPGIEKFQGFYGSLEPDLLMPWKGYGEYP